MDTWSSRRAPVDNPSTSVGLFRGCGMSVMLGMPTLMPRGSARSRPQTKQQNRGSSHVSASSSPSQALQASFISSVMQQPWPACRSAKGGLYTWSQSTPNSIILERVSCVSSTERLFTCAEPRCYFASPSVFIMMALFCLFVGGGYEHVNAWSSVILPHVFSVFLFHEQTMCWTLAFTSPLVLEVQTSLHPAVSLTGPQILHFYSF